MVPRDPSEVVQEESTPALNRDDTDQTAMPNLDRAEETAPLLPEPGAIETACLAAPDEAVADVS